MRTLYFWGIAATLVSAAFGQAREVWRYEFAPSQNRQAQLERVARLHNGAWLLLGARWNPTSGYDALAICLAPDGTELWSYEADGAQFDDAFVDGIEFQNEFALLGRFLDADGQLQTQIHFVSSTGALQRVALQTHPDGGQLRPLRFGQHYDAGASLYAEWINSSGRAATTVFSLSNFLYEDLYPMRPWGVSYAPYSLDRQTEVAGIVASPTQFVDARFTFRSLLINSYSGPARGFDAPLALASTPPSAPTEMTYVGIVSEGFYTGDDVVLLAYGMGPLRWGYRYDYLSQDDSVESLQVDAQGRAHVLVRTVMWRGEPFETAILRLLRFSLGGALEEDALLNIPHRADWGILRLAPGGQRYLAAPRLLGRIGANGQFAWRFDPNLIVHDLFPEPDGSLVVAGERPIYNQQGYLIDYRLAVVKYALRPDPNGDGCVDDADLLTTLFAFGQSGLDLAADVNGDGVVDDADLLQVLFAFGEGC